jgi:hypothetical protein
MKLELSISKQAKNKPSGLTEELVFTILDLDKAKDYPANFVCLLPKNLQRECKPNNSQFSVIFGDNSNKIATKLLTDALRSENDIIVRDEIERRLKAIEPKPTAKCHVCGCAFEPRMFGRFLQTVCRKCRYKNSSSQ